MLIALGDYFAIRDAIDEDTSEPTDRWVIAFSLAVTLLGAGVIDFVFTAPLNPMSCVLSKGTTK
ncbi:hypothetical protein [Coleofasciculus sp. FACHB-129]|uniref:hypothetical protein n=1 Tax=Trichocoleus sp. DQ-A1 TaxID=2933923 RepID=UPI0018EFDB1B